MSFQEAQACAAEAFAGQAACQLQPGTSVVALASPFGIVAPHHFSNMAVTGAVAISQGLLATGGPQQATAKAAQHVHLEAGSQDAAGSDSSSHASVLADQAATASGSATRDCTVNKTASRAGPESVLEAPPLALLDLRAMPGMEGGVVCDAQGRLAGILLQPLLQVKTGVEVQALPLTLRSPELDLHDACPVQYRKLRAESNFVERSSEVQTSKGLRSVPACFSRPT